MVVQRIGEGEGDGRRVLIGRIVGVHGVRGEVKLESYTDPRLAIFDCQPWSLERTAGRVETVAGVTGRAQGKGIVARLPGTTDRDAALSWMGASIRVARSALPELQPGEYYRTDLEGLKVVNLAGEDLGRVSHLFGNGAHDVIVVRDAAGRERLIPYATGVYVKAVDLDAGCITVDWNPED